jgi:hypothetical protein
MAIQTKVHGDFQPVTNMDAREYATVAYPNSLNAVDTGLTVQIQGPKLDFFTVTGGANCDLSQTGNIATAISTVQQLSTVYLYNVSTSSTGTINLAVYPTGAYTAANLALAINTAIASNVTNGNASVSTGATFA